MIATCQPTQIRASQLKICLNTSIFLFLILLGALSEVAERERGSEKQKQIQRREEKRIERETKAYLCFIVFFFIFSLYFRFFPSFFLSRFHTRVARTNTHTLAKIKEYLFNKEILNVLTEIPKIPIPHYELPFLAESSSILELNFDLCSPQKPQLGSFLESLCGKREQDQSSF